jgi:2-iminobutanoate/2-iminopropanoate deaminase
MPSGERPVETASGADRRRAVAPAGAAPAIGPYSPALRVGRWLFLSGQIPLDTSGTVVAGGIREQTVQVLENMRSLLEAAGTGFGAVVKTTIYLADLADFAAVNDIYASYFAPPYPARATVQVARLPRDVRVEIDAIVVAD